MSIKLLLEMNHVMGTNILSRLKQKILWTDRIVARTCNEHVVSVTLFFPESHHLNLSYAGT